MSRIEKEQIFELEKRRKIYSFVLRNPGMHLTDISRHLNIPRSTLDYHLAYLERKNLLKSENQGKYTRYFAQYELGTVDKEVLMFLRQDIPRMIILFSYIFDEVYRHEISKALDIPVTTASFHLKKLKESGILGLTTKKGRAAYHLINRGYVYNLFVKYENSISDDDIFSACISTLKKTEEDHVDKPKVNKHIKDAYLDKYIEVTLKLFPIPFCA